MQTIFWKIAKWLIRRDYGVCPDKDYKDPVPLNAQGRCASCQAGEVIEWIDEHLSLMK